MHTSPRRCLPLSVDPGSVNAETQTKSLERLVDAVNVHGNASSSYVPYVLVPSRILWRPGEVKVHLMIFFSYLLQSENVVSCHDVRMLYLSF